MVKKATEATPNHLLRAARKERNWTQKDVADRIGAPQSFNISRWEQGTAFPSSHYVQQLCLLFGKTAKDLGLLLERPSKRSGPAADMDFPPLWSVPYRRNLFFTGREEILDQLHDRLTASKTAALTQTQAISGLGGVGKTQIAVEYAHRYREEYRFILWARAAGHETLTSDFVALANILHLPEENEQDQPLVVAAVKGWLAHNEGWLLILDNADDLELVIDFLPSGDNGHILLTTRAQATGGVASSIAIEKMGQEEGILLLLRRAGYLAPDAPLEQASEEQQTQARAITEAMGGLPLALDQVGAYIEETGCNLSDYLELYRTHHKQLLQRRSSFRTDHPEPVASTWALSFFNVEQANPAAADLLRLCAFLNPDAIPEETITDGAGELGSALGRVAADPLQWNDAIQVLRRYSLIKRDMENRVLNIHRLVQAVLKDGLDDQLRRQWVERAVRAVSQSFPDPEEFTNWTRCQRYLLQAQNCAELILQWEMTFSQATLLLHRAGVYLSKRAQYIEAARLLQVAHSMRERTEGRDHPDVARSLHQLAKIYHNQMKFDFAEPLYRRALAIYEHTGGSLDAELVKTLGSLGDLLLKQGRLEEAQEMFQRGFSMSEQMLAPNLRLLAESVNNLAEICRQQEKYAEAELYYRRALSIAEQVFEPTDPNVTDVVYNLASLLYARGNDDEAESLYRRALANDELSLGSNHPTVASDLNDLGNLYTNQGKYAEAEPLYLRAIAIKEHVQGPNHMEVATSLNNLGLLYTYQGRYSEAETIFLRALGIKEQLTFPDPSIYAINLDNLAVLYRYQKRFEEAEQLHLRALAIFESSERTKKPEIARCLNLLGLLYTEQGRYSEAETYYQRALDLSEQAFNQDHPLIAKICRNYAELLRKLQRNEEAMELEKRATATKMRQH